MISASKSILSLNNLKILRPKITKNITNLQVCIRSFVNPHPGKKMIKLGHIIEGHNLYGTLFMIRVTLQSTLNVKKWKQGTTRKIWLNKYCLHFLYTT